jgi:hypothetical protein
MPDERRKKRHFSLRSLVRFLKKLLGLALLVLEVVKNLRELFL